MFTFRLSNNVSRLLSPMPARVHTIQAASHHFLVIAHDFKDSEALERRMKVRPDHVENAKRLKKSGHILFGGAILSKMTPPPGSTEDPPRMQGSAFLMEAQDEAEVRELLRTDPYITGRVWEKVEVTPFLLAPLPKA